MARKPSTEEQLQIRLEGLPSEKQPLTFENEVFLHDMVTDLGELYAMAITQPSRPASERPSAAKQEAAGGSGRLPQEEDARSERALKGIGHRGAHRPSSYTLAIGPGPA